MRADPPAELIQLVEQVRFAQTADLVAVQERVRRLGNDLPLFPTIWVDALAQARKITPFQAAEINAGRGKQLAVGPFVLLSPVESLGYADCYRAREVESNREVYLLVGKLKAAMTLDDDRPIKRLEELADRLTSIDDRRLVRSDSVGVADNRFWIACPPIKGRPLGDVLRRTGRLQGAAVLDIARQMAAFLASLETAGIAHGDLSPRTVWLDERGIVRFAWTGVRAAFRPDEDFARPDLPPEAFEYIAPERIGESRAPTAASDMFACGCLWWHLAAGRPPFGGGTSRGKLRAVQAAKLIDLRRFTPDAPSSLLSSIVHCTSKDPNQRPQSFHALIELLGQSNSQGRRTVSNAYCKANRHTNTLRRTVIASLGSRSAAAWMTTIAVCCAVIMAVAWPLLRTHDPTGKAKTAAHAVAAAPAQDRAQSTARRTRTIEGSSEIVRASYHEPNSSTPLVPNISDANQFRSSRSDAALQPLVLPADKPTVWNRSPHSLRAGQTVRGQPGERPVIVVPPSGIIVAVEDVRFENVDFVWQPAGDAPLDPERAALIDLRASRASFSGCTFQATELVKDPQPAVICWNGPRRTSRLAPAGRLQLSDCVVSGMSAGIEGRLNAPLEIKLTNVLCLGPGPFLSFDHPPKVDEPIDIALANCTLRGAAALVEFQINQAAPQEIGAVTMTTNDCVLAPASAGALLMFAGTTLPNDLPKSIQWSGQGSLAAPDARVAVRVGAGDPSNRDDLEVAVDGLVSGRFVFAGPSDAGSSASRVTHWLAAGSSPEPPGIRDGLPNLRTLESNER